MSLRATTWQTVGPYFRIGLSPLFEHDIAGEGVEGQRMRVEGRILDGDGVPIPDACIEIWQANAHGKYAHPEDAQDKPLEQGFRGFARIPADEQGIFRFTTVKPGSVPGPGGRPQAPHLVISITMRGLMRGLLTRAYFQGEPGNASDPILQRVPTHRRETLMLQPVLDDPCLLRWTIRMQGERETVFFDFCE